MKHHFYSHLVEIDTIVTEMDVLDLNAEEKNELVRIVETTVHHVVLNTVLKELTEEDKKQFLAHLAENKHSELWKMLTEKVPDIHEKIKQSVHSVKKEMTDDIQETHKTRKK